MKKILAFAGSNSKESINNKLIGYATQLNSEMDITHVDISALQAPIYNIDIEQASGIPESIQKFYTQLQTYDAYIIAFPEHNGMMPAFIKNIIDWMSRINNQFLGKKPVLLLSTSPGPKGGANSLQFIAQLVQWWGANTVETLSLGNFFDQYDQGLNQVNEPQFIQNLQKSIQNLATN